MRLKSLRYAEFEGSAQEWALEGLSLGDSNLVVGKNASGKTRALNVIHSLSRLLAGMAGNNPISSNYDVEFLDDGTLINYRLRIEDQLVVEEAFSLNGKSKLQRKGGGEGKIWAEQIENGTEIRFQTPTSDLAVVARRDTIQHPFLESLHAWGNSVRLYYFGSSLGKEHLAVLGNKGSETLTPDEMTLLERDSNRIVAVFRQAVREFDKPFIEALLRDMKQVGYELENIETQAPVSIRVSGLPGDLVGISVKEKDLPGITDQYSMSQGMFRALSLLVQINYSQMTGRSTCIIVDDIGEGLDFDRSCRLIDLLREKAKASRVQLIMSTNDRFVMNRVPLEEWSVLQRRGNHVRVLNNGNSKNLFEEFKFTGLSNFSFLEMDFASGPPQEENNQDESTGGVC